jgi:hypothetical protein
VDDDAARRTRIVVIRRDRYDDAEQDSVIGQRRPTWDTVAW